MKPYVSPQVWALVELQRLTAARPGELVIMRLIDIDMTGRVWTYTPQTHKNSYRSQQRTIYVGPRAQEVVRPFLSGRPVEAFMFSPAEAEVERRAAIHASRETPLSYGNRPGTNCKRRPSKQPGDCYTTDSYRRAIIYGCDRAFPPPDDIRDDPAVVKQWRKEHRWHPHQLRHSAATMLRKEFGLEAAQLLLGHVHADVTQVYAEVNHTKALEVAEKIG
ncbi:MAG: site-specific integrase [Planctomycetes bacterium]|nr:site-specific integrase [Planctomycetota bacterium]